MKDPVALCARGQARFYELAYAALGVTVRARDGVWWAPVAGPVVFPVAGTLDPSVGSPTVAARLPVTGRAEVSDAWGVLDLARYGLRPEDGDPWMVRPAGPTEVPPVPGLTVVPATTADLVLTTERTVVLAAGGSAEQFPPGSLHPGAATVAQADLKLFLGLLDGVPVATAMAAVAGDCVFVSGVATLPRARGQGVATALTAAALAAAADRPAVLSTTVAGRDVYARMGFREVGRPVAWSRD